MFIRIARGLRLGEAVPIGDFRAIAVDESDPWRVYATLVDRYSRVASIGRTRSLNRTQSKALCFHFVCGIGACLDRYRMSDIWDRRRFVFASDLHIAAASKVGRLEFGSALIIVWSTWLAEAARVDVRH